MHCTPGADIYNDVTYLRLCKIKKTSYDIPLYNLGLSLLSVRNVSENIMNKSAQKEPEETQIAYHARNKSRFTKFIHLRLSLGKVINIHISSYDINIFLYHRSKNTNRRVAFSNKFCPD